MEQVLADTDLGALSEEQKNVYLPQITALLEERVGLELLPKLDEAQTQKFGELMDKDAAAEQWAAFWPTAMPKFEEEMKRILAAFAKQVKGILAKTAG